jgi:hypothetical protein
MSKQRKSNPEKLRLDADWLAKQMAAVATIMWTLTEQMDDFDWDGFSPKMKPRARILAMHGAMLSMWADEVRAQAKQKIGDQK